MSCIVSLYSMEEINLVSTNLQSVLVSFFFSLGCLLSFVISLSYL